MVYGFLKDFEYNNEWQNQKQNQRYGQIKKEIQ